ncbi:MAG TPA: hypothetical protein VF796_13030 [Humisphaera sp.]
MLKRHVWVRRAAVAAAALVGAGAGATAQAAMVGLDWGTTAVGPTETAGVVAMQNWTSLSTSVGTVGGGPTSLRADDGTAAGSVTWVGGTSTNTGLTNSAGNNRMMFGYLDTAGNTAQTVVTVTGLPASITGAPYAVIVYYDTPNGTENRVGRYALSGVTTGANTLYGRDAASTNFAGTFVQGQTTSPTVVTPGSTFNDAAAQSVAAGNYLVFTDVSGSSFTLTATPYVSSGNNPRAPINGMQIVPMAALPEPGSVAAAALAGAGLLLRRARRRA